MTRQLNPLEYNQLVSSPCPSFMYHVETGNFNALLCSKYKFRPNVASCSLSSSWARNYAFNSKASRTGMSIRGASVYKHSTAASVMHIHERKEREFFSFPLEAKLARASKTTSSPHPRFRLPNHKRQNIYEEIQLPNARACIGSFSLCKLTAQAH